MQKHESKQLLEDDAFFNAVWKSIPQNMSCNIGGIDRSIRLRPQCTCVQEHASLSNAFLHNSAARAKHTRTHVGLDLSDLRCVVIGQYARISVQPPISHTAVFFYALQLVQLSTSTCTHM